MSTKWLTQVRKDPLGPGYVLEGDRKVKVSAGVRNMLRHRLADHASDDGVCRISMYILATETGLSYRTVRRGLESLEKDGEIERQHRYGKRGYRVADEIRLVSMVARPCVHSGQALETPLTTERRPALIVPVPPEEKTVRIIDLTDEGPQGYLEEHSRIRPTKKPKAKTPSKFNAVTTADYVVNRIRQLQWGVPGAVPAKEFGRHFSRWHREEGVSYREIVVAIDLFCDEWPGLDIPAGRVFLKQRFDWISRAKEEIYHQELPKKQAANHAMWDQIYADLAVWDAANPGASERERNAYKAERWKHYKQDPVYA